MNRLAEEGFARGAEAYARARPSYPPAAIERLRAELGLTAASAVLDLGAGTGKLTELLTGLGRVIAVEPVAEMRAALAALPFAEAREGRAEGIPLGDGEVDAVVVGQAFHWFATAEVLREIHRVLKPRGGLGLVWNRWDRRVDWADRVKGVTAPYDALRPQYETYDWKAAFEGQRLFGPLASEELSNGHRSTREDVCVRMASTSSIAVLRPAEQAEVLARVRAILDAHPETARKAELTVPYLTELFWARRLD